MPHEVHAKGPTYKGKNRKLIAQDACDPIGAAVRDSEEMVRNAPEADKEIARRAADEIQRRARERFGKQLNKNVNQ